jgi:hypothetical protein
MRTIRQTVAVGAVLTVISAGAVFAHHGWSWTSSERFILSGVIQSVYYGNPHSQLIVAAEDGVWTVDLAPPMRSANAGFVDGVAEVGDEVIAIGNRSLDPEEKHMKARRVVIDGVAYDVYTNDYPPGLAM